jgi:hypothetical protein
MQSVVLTGALIKLYINNKLFNTVQSVSFTIDYGETPIYGIDSPFPQEIGPGRVSVSGAVQGLRTKNSGGIQAYDARPLILDTLASPYISIRIQDRATAEDILFIPQAKINKQDFQASAKGTIKLNFSFTGLIPYEALDRS